MAEQAKTNNHRTKKIFYQNETIKYRFTGLKNLGMTGYMNCILYQLFMMKQFRFGIINAGIELENKLSENQLNDSLLYQLMRMFSFLSLSNKSSFDTTDFCKAYKDENGKPINVNIPNDSQFFFNTLIDRIRNELNETKYRDLMNQCLIGNLYHQISCTNCNAVNRIYQSFIDIGLCVINCSNIKKSLTLFVKTELLCGMLCSHRCGTKTTHTYTKRLSSLPNIIFFSLKRSTINFENEKHEKLNIRFEFAEKIDLRKYTDNNDDEQDEYFEYELNGVVVHNGTAEGGKYYSLIRNNSDMRWILLLNGFIGIHETMPKEVMQALSLYHHYYEWIYVIDDHIQRFDLNKLEFETFGGGNGVNSKRNAYMLVYERKQSVDMKLVTFDLDDVEKCIKKAPQVWNEIIKQNKQRPEKVRICANCKTKQNGGKFNYKKCKCTMHNYCSKRCQKLHWRKVHRTLCLEYIA